MEWTSVKDKLPTKDTLLFEDEFLVTVDIGGVRCIEMARFDGEKWINKLFDSDDVVAWTLLPKPYYGD